MERYEEARLGNKSALPVEEILGLKIPNDLDVLNCDELSSGQQNLNFGAEIPNANMLESEEQIKTNLMKITNIDEAPLRDLSNAEIELHDLLNDLQDEVPRNGDHLDDVRHSLACIVGVADNENNGTQQYVEQITAVNVGAESVDADADGGDGDGDGDADADADADGEGDGDSGDDSSDSDFSDLSGLSDISGRDWKPIQIHPLQWVQRQINSGANPRALLSQMLPSSARSIAPGLDDMTLWRILASMLTEPPRRQKLSHINTFDDVIQLIRSSKNIMILTGAGVSVSCGIPDFRSSDGIYARLAKDYPDLPDPQAMFDINYFSRDPRPFFKFAREIYPGQFKPSPCHRFIKLLEEKKKLLRNYTQNIDTLEQVAGIQNVIECHGSFSTASCTKCKYKCDADAIRDDIFAQCIPVCPRCQPNVQQSVDASQPVSETDLKQLVQNGIMKPDIVFFGEGLPELFHTVMASDKDNCDLLIVMGSSLKVRPVALIPSSIPANVPQILINREQLHHLEFDVELLGDSDVIINQLCHRLGEEWSKICFDETVLNESEHLIPIEECCAENEEYGQQIQDTDTQSVQSNASTDIALRSAGASSDSGFESSTCSAVTKPGADSVDGTMDSVDFGNPDFHPFVERLGNETSNGYPLHPRHMSVDSTKDSGIQCDASIGLAGQSANTGCTNSDEMSASSSSPPDNYTKSMQESDIKIMGNKLVIPSSSECSSKQRRRQRRISVGERLLEGTYYRHMNGYSYVFPGAQVSWCTDSEDDEDSDDDENDEDEIEDDVDDEKSCAEDTESAPLSPLLPPSVEAEMVNEITSTRCTSSGTTTTYTVQSTTKRASSQDYEIETNCTVVRYSETDGGSQSSSPTITKSITPTRMRTPTNVNMSMLEGSPPPTKRRRDSAESDGSDNTTDDMPNNNKAFPSPPPPPPAALSSEPRRRTPAPSDAVLAGAMGSSGTEVTDL